VEYAALVEVYERLAGTQSTHEKTAIVAETLAETAHEDLPMTAQLLRGTLFAPWNPAELGVSSSLATRAIERATGVPAEEVEADWRETGDLGSAAARAVERAVQQTLVSETLTVEGVYADLRELAGYEGTGSEDRRVDTVAGLLADADPDEAQYVVRTALGHLRLGVGRGTVRDAIAAAFLGGDPDEPGETPEADVQAVERALQVTNDPGLVAQTAADAGRPGLADLDLEVGRPVEVMLAEKADSVEAAVADTLETSSATDGADSGDADPTAPPAPLSEYKVDGFRAQVHFAAGEHGDGATGPRIFTRRLEDVTAQFPDVVDAMDGFDADSYIVEGEIVAYDPDTGEPVPFQQLSRRIKRKHDVERLVEAVPVVLYLFDLLSLDGASLLDRSLVERVDAVEGRLTERERGLERMPNLRSREPDRVREFYEAALAAGHEGLMVKTADAAYQPGKRVGYTRKVKPTMESLDLVVTRAKWSEGRRSNNLGRLYLACRDGDRFREVGRLSTGFTDDQLAELTARLEPHVLEEDGRAVDLEPTEVLEVAYEEVQESPKYDSGYALRFPRFEGFRDDLDVGDADTVERVESLYEGQ
jgi:DNA ligase-1